MSLVLQNRPLRSLNGTLTAVFRSSSPISVLGREINRRSSSIHPNISSCSDFSPFFQLQRQWTQHSRRICFSFVKIKTDGISFYYLQLWMDWRCCRVSGGETSWDSKAGDCDSSLGFSLKDWALDWWSLNVWFLIFIFLQFPGQLDRTVSVIVD